MQSNEHEVTRKENARGAGGLLGSLLELRPTLLRYLKLRGATNEEAEDVIQEAF
jgi:DNA-directed RNA polymerase specialized sigma24 family protein